MKRNEIARLAGDFWRRTEGGGTFPRSLETRLIWALPIAIVLSPGLRLSYVLSWLSVRRFRIEFNLPDRELRACLLAHGGKGLLFVDELDTETERRFSLAHESAHFVLDYLRPRNQAITAIGPAAAEVLDGLRPASPAEKLTSVLRGVQSGPYTHLLERTESGDIPELRTLEAEELADQFALELLAPRQEALLRLRQKGIGTSDPDFLERTAHFLEEDFGLPAAPARAYARNLVGRRYGRQSFSEWLGR